MAKGKKVSKIVNSKTREVDVYAHEDKKRLNNPPVGMA